MNAKSPEASRDSKKERIQGKNHYKYEGKKKKERGHRTTVHQIATTQERRGDQTEIRMKSRRVINSPSMKATANTVWIIT
jgi:hypothetical protein